VTKGKIGDGTREAWPSLQSGGNQRKNGEEEKGYIKRGRLPIWDRGKRAKEEKSTLKKKD